MILIILSFVIVAFGQPAWIVWLGPAASLFGYALFWKGLLKVESPRKRFWTAVLWYALVQSVQLSWMTAVEYQGIYILFVYFGLLIFLGFQFGILTRFIKNKLRVLDCLALASLWTLMEWGRLYIICGFSFNPAGLALTTNLYSLQAASLFGILGLSFWVIFINLFSLKTFDRKKGFTSLAILAVIPFLFGLIALALHKPPEKKFSVALIHSHLLPSEKVPLIKYKDSYFSPFEQWKLIVRALKNADQKEMDLIILPEAAVCHLADSPAYPFKRVSDFLISELGETVVHSFPHDDVLVSNLFWAQTLSNFFNAEIVIGLDDRCEIKKENYQAAFHLIPHSSTFNRYEKNILVPLGESLPFEWLRPLIKNYGIEDFYTPGKGAKVFKNKIPFSVSICYEETFSNFMRQGRLLGAELFVNLSNDNWYPHSQLGQQHFDLARLRSVENGVPLIRSCNFGVTGAVDSLGRVVSLKKSEKEDPKCEVVVARIPLAAYPTLYTFWGDAGIVLPSFFFLIAWLLARKKLDEKV